MITSQSQTEEYGNIINLIEAARASARAQNNDYERRANELNDKHGWGFTAQDIDILKHTLAAANETLNQGAYQTRRLIPFLPVSTTCCVPRTDARGVAFSFE